MSPIVRRGTGKNAIEIFRKARGFHQSLAAAIRTAEKIRILRCVAEARANDLLGDFGHNMNGAIAEVGDFFRTTERPRGVNGCAGVAGVGAGGRVALENGSGEGGIIEFTCEASVSLGPEFPVPGFGGEPSFDEDVAVGGRVYADPQPAESGGG